MDPELAAIVARLPTFEAGGPQEARAQARAFTVGSGREELDQRGLAIGERSIPGPQGAPDIRVRVYEPPRRENSAPCLVYFHGGGFIAGDLDTEDSRCIRLAAGAECVIVSVDYRLAPEHPFPAAVEDSYEALRWATGLARQLGVDRARIGVGGGSAGATLAAAVALMARDRGGPPVAFQLLVSPALDDRMQTQSARVAGTPLLDATAITRMWSSYLGEDRSDVSAYAAPARAKGLSGLPPTYLMTAELDPLRDEGLEYARRLLDAGVSVELHHFAGAFHGFDLLPSAISRRAADEQVDWLRAVSAAPLDGSRHTAVHTQGRTLE